MPKIKVNNPKNIIKGTPTRYYFKLHNTGGPKGDKGDTGDTGPRGPKGDTGNAATVQVGSTTTLPVGQDATVENVGNQYAAILNFGIPQGPQGPKGDKGDKGDTGATGPQGATGAKGDPGTNATVYIGKTSTGNPGTQASVYNSGSDSSAVLNFTIPQGATGATGPANTLSIGSVTKGADASATITGDAPNQTLNLVLPKGDKGDTGATGAEGPRGPQGIQGETGEAFSIYKTYPSVADMNADASNVPEGKFTLIASNVDDPDNSKLFVKNGEGTFTYLTDMSGAQGIQGPAGPQGVRGDTGPVGPQGETGPRGSVKSQYVAELPATGDEETFYLVDRDLESHTATGEYINIEPTQTAAAIQSAQIDGNATQTTYSGKNLLNFDAFLTYSNVTYTKSGDTYNVTNFGDLVTNRYPLTLEAGKTYTLSLTKVAQGTTNVRVQVYKDGTLSGGAYCSVTSNPNYCTFTAVEGSTYELNATYTPPLSTPVVFSEPMLEQSATKTDYEPYVGGTASPNPDYPQPISTVTGENVVKITGINIVPNTEFDTLDGWTASSYWSAGGNSTLNLNIPANTNTFQKIYQQLPTTANHKYYVCAEISQPNGSSSTMLFLANNISSNYPTPSVGIPTSAFTNRKCSGILQPTADNAHIGLMIQAYNKTVPITATIKNLFCVDLTVMYGAGNEPTKDECDNLFTYGPYQGEDYDVNLGKNLLQPSTMFATSHNVTVESKESSVEITSGIGYAVYTVPTRFEPTDKVTFSCKGVQKSGDGLRLVYRHSDDGTTWTGYVDIKNLNTTVLNQEYELSGTITGYRYYQIVFYSRGYSSTSTTNNAIYSNVQFEKGNQVTPFAPYFTPLELAKIGTYQDRIYKDDGKWYIEKQVGKVVFDGDNEVWRPTSGNSNYFYTEKSDVGFAPSDSTVGAIMSDNYTATTANRLYSATDDYGIAIRQSPTHQIWIRNKDCADKASFMTWLSSHPTTVYYALATPTTTEITDTNLINQLEALASATLGHGVNNIWTEIATGNAMPTLELNWVEWEKYNKHNVYIWNDDIDDWQVIVQ